MRLIPEVRASVALSILVAEIFLPSQALLASDVFENKPQMNPGIPAIGREYIRAPQASSIMLTGVELEDRQAEYREEKSQPSPAVATTYMEVSAYNSLPNQTDGSPYHTAIGSLTRDGVVASNYFPIGTRLRFPDVFGDKEFRVEDRMNPRYDKVADIWMEDINDARKFGRRYLKVEVVKYGLGRGVE